MEGHNCCQNGEQNGRKTAQVAVVMVPFLAQSHLNQLLHLSSLITSHGIPVHYAGSTTHNLQVKLRFHGWNPESSSKIHFHDLKLSPFSSPPPNPTRGTQFPVHLQPVFNASLHLRQPVHELLQQLASKFKRIIVIHDTLMSYVVQDVNSIPNAEAYNLLPVSAFSMFCNMWEALPEKPFQLDPGIPTCIPSLQDSTTPEFKEFLDYQLQLSPPQSGRLYNTCRLIEGKYVELLEKLSENTDKKHFIFGPFHPVQLRTRSEEGRHGCLEWLEKQEKDSVIYVSFGSTTTMTDEQIKELALGLERSGEKFIWVLRDADMGDIFAENQVRRPHLPEGYEERVRDKGIVVREWAPQLEILAHPSTGGFMSHCGWNSCLESISMGVPIAAWPMHSDQPKNAILITQVLRTGIEVMDWAHRTELVASTTIENAVKSLMTSKEGVEMRKRAAELGDAVRASVAEGGASHLELESFLADISR